LKHHSKNVTVDPSSSQVIKMAHKTNFLEFSRLTRPQSFLFFCLALDLTVVARSTPGFSGADLQNLVNQAAVKASREGAQSVRALDFDWARDRIMMGAENKSYITTADVRVPTSRRIISLLLEFKDQLLIFSIFFCPLAKEIDGLSRSWTCVSQHVHSRCHSPAQSYVSSQRTRPWNCKYDSPRDFSFHKKKRTLRLTCP
jgi:SpoVK/Ycf46/Vps4 family AAA+-type ATPase